MSTRRRSTRLSHRSETSDVEMPEAAPKKLTVKEEVVSPSKPSERPPYVDPASYEIVGQDFISNTYDAHLNRRDFNKYLDTIQVVMVNENIGENTIEFDLINVEAAIANAIRRIMIAEVPTMAFEKIFLYQNDTVFQDEVFCHRLGLLPVYADPRRFVFPDNPVTETNVGNDQYEEEPEGKPEQELIFEIKLKCKKKKTVPAGTTNINEHFENGVVYSKAFKWIPIGNQEADFKLDPPRMVHDDILVLKMRHGQEVEARCHAVKGIGRDHAKFSPVGTASYRLLPEIVLKRDVRDQEALLLQKCFSKGVIEIDKDGAARVADSRLDTLSRNAFRYEEFKDAVEIRRKKNHYVFSVESIGQYRAHEIPAEACSVMINKIRGFRNELLNVLSAR